MSKVNEPRAAALAHFDKKVIRLEDIAGRLTKLLGRVVEQLQNHMFDGLGYKDNAPIDDKTVKLLKEVTAAFNSASDAQVRLDKTAAQRAKAMSHEDRKKAVADFILTLPVRERAEWITALIKRHDELKVTGGRPLLGMPHVTGVKADAADAEDA